MVDSKMLTMDILNRLPVIDKELAEHMLNKELADFTPKIVVLDDDPTGVQTVHDVSVYTDWSQESIDLGFQEENSMFFILTNSRGFTHEETVRAHREIAEHIVNAYKKFNRPFLIISRGDSTLRGHYPTETQVLKETIEKMTDLSYDGELIMPFFKEGGRLTYNNIHYVQYGEDLVPAGETEFAKDRTFGYKSSHLGEWIEEKTNGDYTADETTYLSLDQIRNLAIDSMTNQLCLVKNFNKIVVNAVDQSDVLVSAIAFVRAIKSGKNFLFRTAAAFPKAIGGVSDRALLSSSELCPNDSDHGGLIIVGSHVQKTTNQLQELKKNPNITFIELDVQLIINDSTADQELSRVVHQCEEQIRKGQTVTVYTSRKRIDLGPGKKEEELKLSVSISNAVTRIVRDLKVQPSYVIAKGGITSSDIGTKGLGVKKAKVLGQILPGIPVWQIGSESKYPGISYVIFPGNVGTTSALREAVDILEKQKTEFSS
ncbi:four-carbon acid sugar kinase family protein [Sporolactobacillus kofuensis]|uniref:Four-carbon acid sugar kinase family protein n=1 Tax=Sporolactobacillus kofuensis TaxID=269672 RepID=A0ABW1WEY6_9BACL|nr:four-carbon acid sugar kinase family protein [Sporolactobacillus kofuensis]MCO7174888.1 hydroxyacid dehydrogenase [Sporolactobacillus kofuensis]